MPIDVSHVEDRIILAQWQGVVTLEEIFQAGKDTTQIAETHHYDDYIQILQAVNLIRVPFELRMLSKVVQADKHVRGYVVVGAPKWTQMITRVVSIASSIEFEHVTDYEDGLKRARELRNQLEQSSGTE
jgi:predicted transcriptional regulator